MNAFTRTMRQVDPEQKSVGAQLLFALSCSFLFLVSSTFADADCDEKGPSQLPDAALLDAFVEDIRPDRAALGFRSRMEIDAEGRRSLRVDKILEGGAAAETDLAVGDAIIAFDGKPLPPWKNDLDRVVQLDLDHRAGDRIELTVERDGQERRVWLTAARMSESGQRERIQWVRIATERLEAGHGLYCSDPAGLAESRRRAEKRERIEEALWAALGSHKQVRMTFTRLANGKYGIATDPEIEIPEGFSIHHFEGLEEKFESSEVGEELGITLINPKYRG